MPRITQSASAPTAMDAKRAINGREGRVYIGNQFLGWVESIDARVVIDRQDIIRSGSHSTGYKPTGSTGTGTLNGFHVTSFWRRLISEYTNNHTMPQPAAITMELSDPDQFGGVTEEVTLDNCYFWETPLGFDATAIVMDDIPFTFEKVTWTGEIRDTDIEPLQTAAAGITPSSPLFLDKLPI